MDHYRLSLQRIFFLLSFLLASFSSYSQVLLEADGPGGTYELIEKAFGSRSCEVPDQFDISFGRHIAEVWDADLGKYVFEFYMHSSKPDELFDQDTKKSDRQRNEIKIFEKSQDYLKGSRGRKMSYKWKFKIPVGFMPSPKFTHLHQIKAVGGDAGAPLFTLTPRSVATGNQLELIYGDGSNQSTKFASVNLSLFEGIWVEATEKIKVDDLHGSYSMLITNLSTGATIMSYSNNDLCTIRSTNSFIRPKWGIYRNVTALSYLRDEAVRFASFFIEQGKD